MENNLKLKSKEKCLKSIKILSYTKKFQMCSLKKIALLPAAKLISLKCSGFLIISSKVM